MGYKSERNRGLAQYFEENPDKSLWDGWGDNLLTRTVSGAGRGLFMDIPRGLARAGGAVLTDIAEVVKEPLGAALEGSGLIDREKREQALGPAGWWTQVDPMTGESTGRRASSYSDLLQPMGKSFWNTSQLIGQASNPANYMKAMADIAGEEVPDNPLAERYREFVNDPFNFGLEHVGNVALTGSVVGKAGNLGVAARSGAITRGQALRGARPLAGRGVRTTARSAAEEAASAGNRGARASLFAEDVLGRPYRSLAKAITGSQAANFFRNPIPLEEAKARLSARLRTMSSEEGSFDFRPGDLRRDWNETAKKFNEDAQASNDLRYVGRLADQLENISNNMRSRGMEVPEWRKGEDLVPEFDPNEVALREPDAVQTVEDFRWVSDGVGREGEGFTRGLVDNLQTEVEILGGDLTPETIHTIDVGMSKDKKTAYYVNKQGRVAGVVEVSPYSGINIAVEASERGKGISQRLLEQVAEAAPDMDWQSALSNTTTSEFGTRLQERMRQRMASGEVQVNPEVQGSKSRAQFIRDASPEETVTTLFGDGLPDSLDDVFSHLDTPPHRRYTIEDTGGSLEELGRLAEESVTRRRVPRRAQARNERVQRRLGRLFDPEGMEADSNIYFHASMRGLPEQLFPESFHVGTGRAAVDRVSDYDAMARLQGTSMDPAPGGVYDVGAYRIRPRRMRNTPDEAVPDSSVNNANGDRTLPGQEGQYYINDVEDPGSVSAVVGNALEDLQEIARLQHTVRGRSVLPDSQPQQMSLQDIVGQIFGSEEGSIANPFAPRTARDPNAMGPVAYGANLAGIKVQDFLDSELGSRFSEPMRDAKSIVRDRTLALRSGEGPIAGRALDAITSLRGRGIRGVNHALDARTTEAKLLRGIHTLHKRPEGADYAALRDRLDFGEGRGVRGRLSDARDVASGRRAVGANLPADKLVHNIYEVFEEARQRSAIPEQMTDEIGRILPGVDAESLGLLAMDAIEKAQGLPDGSMSKALADYIQGDTYFLDYNRRAQALARDAGRDTTPARFRISDDHLDVDINNLPEQAQELFFEAARQRRITQRFMEEAKAQAPGGNKLFNTRSGNRIGLSGDEATSFGVNAEYLNEVLGTFDQSLDDFGGDVDAAMDALDELQEEFFDVDVHTIKRGNATQAQKNRIAKKQKEFEKRQSERTEILEEIDKVQSKENWTKRDWERYSELQQRSKTNLNQVITSAARLGKLREVVAGSLEAAPVSARNLLLYAREVAPEQIKVLQGMLDDGVGDPAVIQELIDDLSDVPRTIEELNDAQTYVSYLKDVRDTPNLATTGRSSSSTRGPALRRRGVGTDATYVQDLRQRLQSQDMDFQRYYIAKAVRDVVKEKGLSKSGYTLLREHFNLDADSIKNLTEGEIQDILSHGGFKVFAPDSLFELRRAPEGDPLQAEWMRADVGEVLTKGMKQPGIVDTALQATYDKVLRGWKAAVLPLRPAWHVNNIFGNAFLAMFSGKVNPADYAMMLNASRRAVKSWNEGLSRTIEIPLSKRHLQELMDSLPSMEAGQRALAQDILDKGFLTLDNTILNEIASNGLIQGDFAFLNNSQFFRTLQPHEQGVLRRSGLRKSHPRMPKNLEELGDVSLFERGAQRTRNLRATGREIVDISYHINETVDNINRTLVYLDQMRQGKSHAEAISSVNKALGDYNKLSDFERRVVRRVYPFWPWMRHMLETVGRSLQPDNIGRSLIFGHVTNILGAPNGMEELLPEYAAGDIYVGDGEDGTPMFYSVRGLNPFLDVFDPIMQPNMRGLTRPMGPILTMIDEQRTGISNLTGRPFSSPVQRADGMPQRPSVSEQLWRQVPQLNALRNVYRDITGQPLTRYGTGEPAIFPGAENDKTSLTNIGQLFGANIRPMNVQQMKAREKMRLFQEASDKARQEAKERAYSLENARSLTTLFR